MITKTPSIVTLAFFEKARRDTALGGWVVRPDALNGQLITNAPDQVITDHSVAGDGVKKLPVNNIPNDSLVYTETIVELTRMMSGATEVMAGEVLGKNMSGAAIAQLQSQAEKPIEELRQKLLACERETREGLRKLLQDVL